MLLMLSTVIIGVVIMLFIFALVSMSVNWKDYQFYKPTYNAIKTQQFVLKSNWGAISYFKRMEDEYNSYTPEILFFHDDQDRNKIRAIKLLTPSSSQLNYIHEGVGFCDLYQWYWYAKIIKQYRLNSSYVYETNNRNKKRYKPAFKFLR